MNNTFKTTLKMLALGLLLAAGGHAAQAQGTNAHTFVSGVGTNAAPCSQAAPCLTFAFALTQTAAGGTITAVDPGDFGPVTIAQSVTIDGTGTLATATAPGNLLIAFAQAPPAGIGPPSSAAITVSAGTADVVILRHLSLSGAGAFTTTGTAGIEMTSGGTLLVEDCKITSCTNAGIALLVNTGTVVIKKTSITNCAGATGITAGNGAAGAASPLLVSIKDATIQGTAMGISAVSGMTDVSQSLITQNTAMGVVAAAGTSLSVSGCMLSGNATAVQSAANGAVRLTDNDLFNNTMAINANGGIVSSTGNNRRAGNTTAMQPPTPGDLPNKTITQQ